MKNLLPLLLLLGAYGARSQSFIDFKDSQTIALEGVEFGYSIVNQHPKMVDSVEFNACNIEWYITNKERFSKVFILEAYNKSTDIDIDFTRKICLGRIQVSNAIARNAKEKFSEILQDPNMMIEVFRKNFIVRRKNKLEAYNLQPGETLTSDLTVMVPKGQKPSISLQAFLSSTY